jgi:hypothetical protein
MKTCKQLTCKSILIITLAICFNALISAQDKNVTIKGEKTGPAGFAVSEILKEAKLKGYNSTSRTGATLKITIISDSQGYVALQSKCRDLLNKSKSVKEWERDLCHSIIT